jgi:hypothetical protein
VILKGAARESTGKGRTDQQRRRMEEGAGVRRKTGSMDGTGRNPKSEGHGIPRQGPCPREGADADGACFAEDSAVIRSPVGANSTSMQAAGSPDFRATPNGIRSTNPLDGAPIPQQARPGCGASMTTCPAAPTQSTRPPRPVCSASKAARTAAATRRRTAFMRTPERCIGIRGFFASVRPRTSSTRAPYRSSKKEGSRKYRKTGAEKQTVCRCTG